MKLLKGLLVVLLVVSTLGGYSVVNVQAETTSDETLELNQHLTDWVLDNTRNNIYAITKEGNLLVISRDTYSVKNTLLVGTGLSDLDLEGDTLWIAMKDQNQVAKVNLTTLTVDQTISLSQSPYSIEVLDNKLYYSFDQHSEIKVVDLATNTESFVDIVDDTLDTFYEPDLESNESGVLYVAESGSSGSHIFKVSLTDNTILSKSTYDDGYGFGYPERKVILNSNEVFYAGRSLVKGNLDVINGTYKAGSNDETILDVTDQFVFSQTTIYDRDEFRPVASLPFETNFVLAPSMNEVYLFNENTMTIHKVSFDLPTTLSPQQYSTLNQKIELSQEINDWVLDDANGKIYAVSMVNNKLLTIDVATMDVIKEQSAGSFPSDIDLIGGKLFIANFGSTSISVFDLETGLQSEITTIQNPYRIATDGQMLYYVTEDQWTDVYEVDLVNDTEVVVAENLSTNDYSFYEPDIEYDPVNTTLYIGESGLSGSHLYAMNTQDLTLSKTDFDGGYGFPSPSREVILDGNNLYYAQYQISKADLTNEIWNYNEDIIGTSTDNVLTKMGIYSKANNLEKAAGFPYEVSHASMNTEGNVLVYVPENQSIYKFDSVQAINAGVPTNLTAVINPENELLLSWDATTADYYQVAFKTEGMTSSQPLHTNQLVDNQLKLLEEEYAQWAGQTVTFSVESIVGTYTSEPVTFDYTFKPDAPINFIVKKDMNNNLVFDWEPVTADFYKLYYKTSEITDYLPIDDAQLLTPGESLTEEEYQQWLGQTVTFAVKAFAGDKVSDPATVEFLVDETVPEETSTPSTGGETGTEPIDDNDESTVPENDGSEDADPTDLFDLDGSEIVRTISTLMPIYEYTEDAEEALVNLHESIINEMNQTGNEAFYLESDLGSFQIPIQTLDEYTDDEDSYIQVTIEKVAEEITQSIEDIAREHLFDVISEPIDFSVNIIENGTSTTITSYGDEFVERRIPIEDPSDLEDMMVVVLDPENGTYQPVPTTIEQDENGQYWAVFHRNGNSIYALVKTSDKQFTDVVDHWAKSQIENLASRLILNGVNDHEFEPERSVSRAEFAAMLSRALGLTSEDGNVDAFEDISDTDWYNEAIYAAYGAELINGYTDGTFRPEDTLSREEMITMTVRALELVNGKQSADLSVLQAFDDKVDVGDWAKESLSIAIDQDLIKGRTETTLAPDGTVTRAEAAVITDRLIKKLDF